MSITLTGRLAALEAKVDILDTNVDDIETRLGTPAAGTVAGDVESVETKVDTVDTVVDAIKSTTDTNLDAKVSEVGGSDLLTFPQPTSRTLRGTVFSTCDGHHFKEYTASVKLGQGTDVTVVSITGKGVISFLAVSMENVDRNTTVKLTVDGVEVFDYINAFGSADDGKGFVPIGGLEIGLSNTSFAFGYIEFNSSWKLEADAATGAGSNDVTAHVQFFTK